MKEIPWLSSGQDSDFTLSLLGVQGSISSQETKILQATWHSQKKNENYVTYCRKLSMQRGSGRKIMVLERAAKHLRGICKGSSYKIRDMGGFNMFSKGSNLPGIILIYLNYYLKNMLMLTLKTTIIIHPCITLFKKITLGCVNY